ncbi:MAG: cysteine desulfurase [Candidatus Marsarchaeota archaeon]
MVEGVNVVERIRRDFPIFSRRENGKPLVYLDSAATSQRPVQVINAVVEFYEKMNSNVHRGLYALSEEATEAYENARKSVASFLGCKPEELIFTRNATEALNLVAFSWGRANLSKGDVIVTTQMEHHSNMLPWQMLAAEKGARLEYVRITEDGLLDQASLEEKLSLNPKILALTQVSNVLGTINDVKTIAKRAHEVGAICLVDGAQSVPHMPVDVSDLGCDFLAFSGHKMLGPMGIGGLFGRYDLLDSMPPFLTGGEMIKEVSLKGASWNDVPYKFEAGTPNVEGAIGLSAAVSYLRSLGMSWVRSHEVELTAYALSLLDREAGVAVYGPREEDRRGGVISFNVSGVHAHDVAQILDSEGVTIRSGHHCAMPVMERYGIPAAARASFYVYNDEGDVDALLRGIRKVKRVFSVGRGYIP